MEKNWKKRWMAGAMAFALCCTTLLQTGASAVSAAEVGGVSAQSETQIEVQTETQTETQTEKSEEELIEETVADPELALMVTEGEAFDIQNDFTGLKLSEGDHVELKKAAMEDGTVFDYNHAGTYKCVYLVTPASGEAYLVARNITVTPREAETDGSNGGQEQETGDDEPEADPVLSTISPEDAPETLEEPEETEEPEEEEAEGFSDEETEDGSHQVDIVQGNEFNIELDHEDGRYQTGDTVNFSGDIPQGSLIAVGTSLVEANQTENTEDLLYAEVSYDEGTNSFSFEMPEDDVALSVLYDQAEGGISTMAASDGDLWDDSTDIEANTYYYYSDGKLHPFDSVMGQGGNDSYKYIRYKTGGKTYTVYAYCMQHSKQSPPSGTTYKNMVELDEGGDDRYLRKAMFYGYGGPGWGGTFNGYNIKSIMEKYGCSSETRAMQHYLVDYLYDGESGFGGSLSTTAKNMLKEIKAALAKMPDPTTMELTPGLSASANGNQSPTFTWKANAAFVITVHLENGVSLVNETTGKTGTGNVSVKGGEKFHLEATTQNIGSLKGKYAITSNYPLNFHAMLLKLANSQDIGFGYYTDTLELNLEVDWPDEATVKIIKKDKGSNALLAGAVYGIYADEACTKLIKKMPATNAKGESEVKITKTQDTVYLREISGPSGYVLDTKAYGVKLVVGQTASKNLTDKEQKGALTIYKEGEVLTGAAVTENGVTFTYEKRKLKGAVYSVYAGADIKAADGTLIYKKGALVKDNLVTGDDGNVTLKNLYLGTYTVTETKAPDNYVCKGESKTVELVYAGQTVEVQTGSATFLNERQKAAVRVEKQDEETKNPLSGGIYGLYAAEDIKVDGKTVVPKGTLIEKATTGADGKASYKAELPINYSYSIREIQAPELYLRNSENTYTFTFKFTNDKEEKVNFSHTFTNKRVNATIDLVKEDSETGNSAQGDAVFEGAIYGLYAREDINHPDGRSGVLYKKDEQVATLTTDKEGKASVSNLYLGKYYLKEITPPVGYLLDEEEHDVNCDYEGDQVETVKRNTVSKEDVIKQPFQLIKAADNDKTDADLLKGAGFSAYLISSLTVKDDGSYDFTNATPIVLTEDGKTEMFTDERGYACSIPIPYGRYIVRETTTPHNFMPVDDFIVTVTENSSTPQVWRVLLDDEFKAKLKIVKQDDETKQPVLLANTEFKVYDLDAKKYVEQVTTYPNTVVHKSYFTDENGYLILPESLKCGNYRIEEVSAPDGYTQNTQYVEIKVDKNTAYQMDSVSGDAIITVTYENHPVKGKLVIHKSGETLKSFKKDFVYEETSLEGAEFEIYAAEDIFTPDHQVDEQGNRHVIYAKDTLVKTVATNKNGEAVIKDLPLGKYRVKETKAPSGFVLNPDSQEVSFIYKDQNTPEIEEKLEFSNERQKVELSVEKQDAETGKALKGATFGLYNKEAISSGDKVIVKADTLLQEITSNEKGKAAFTLDLPLGRYYVKELQAPAGYVSSDEILEFDATYQGQDVKTIKLKSVKKNQPTTVEVTKADITTGTELDGASMSVLDKDGNVIDSWTSVKDSSHVIKRLQVGKTYILREELAPYGYLRATDVEFTISDTAEVQKVKMEDEVPVARLLVNKKGEFLDSVSLLDNAKGMIEHLFNYVTGNLTDVTFNVYAAEAIRAADGVSADYYAADELVGSITTDGNGIAQMDNLPLGRYYIVEKETSHGYVLDNEPRYVDLTYRDQDTPLVTYSADWQNARQRIQVEVLKKEKDSDKVLSGAIFGLYAADDIVSSKGKVLLAKDTLIELKTTDEDGKIQFVADLPVDSRYYIKELAAPDGYVTDQEPQEFTFEYQGSGTSVAEYAFTFEDEQTTVELSKADLTDKKELPGASLKVTDEDGNTVDEWVSKEEAHIIKGLIVGKKYKMTETKPADGYVTAESIEFTVENTKEVQKHQMLDDVTKVEISKKDITDSSEVPGAKLIILDKDGKKVESWTSTDKPHMVEKLPVGEYTLREEQAPDGYLIAEDVKFTVKDTGKVQKVKMKDAHPYGKLVIKKTDSTSKAALSGAEFELREKESGKVVEKLVTDKTGTATSGKLPIATYKNGKVEKTVEYILVETKAPNGYELGSKKEEIRFEYKDGKTKVIEIVKEIKNTKSPSGSTPTGNSPKTGDSTNIWLPILLAVLSACGIGGVIWYKKKKGN
ncbi:MULTISPECIES: SpaA isopeptide-forming pilin-related protein [Blautia]|uniref:SpaA isopeptide-forming pilin-related protein n=1 Tax=Blautia TaxID=572511 RepID=UPI001D07CCB1|nr:MULTISPECIES: SpaA isopeptide-forming pilin-related protein [Blautia]MCB6741653.1 LPXTG cell wall anchor domain-containing protein [Blautia sp. 210820-DFI.6.14]MCB6957535.1 LPXTG cell wall anchor domain-containing protein [Blautia obeum]MCG4674708.1 LPXTG cell wall anchor domain-containing protein [Blautia obeum]MDE8679655.1 SpaA isopeptide-forming pilin-related protein [Blautia schinkii]